MARTATVRVEPYIIALSGNPIQVVISVRDAENAVSLCPVIYSISVGSETIYEGRVITDSNGDASIQISELLQDVIKAPELSDEQDIVVRPDLVYNYAMTITAEECDPITISDHKLIYGRINERMLDYLNRKGSNIFTYKFLNGAGNFTTSTRDYYYLSELMPIMAIGTGENLDVYGTFYAGLATKYMEPYAINLLHITDDVYGYADLILGGHTGWTIRIESDPSHIAEMFEFRNAFGIFERFLTSGKATYLMSRESEELPGIYSIETGQEIPSTREPEWTMKHTVPTGYVHPKRLPGLMAMLASGEVYRIRDGIRERVKVSCSDKIPADLHEPISFTINVESVGPDHGYIPDLESSEFGYPRLHNTNYNNTYN